MSRKRTRTVASLKRSAVLFAALGDETRLSIVTRLGADGPLSIVSLTAGTDVTRQAVTKHLRVLARAGFVRSKRAGREKLWAIEPEQWDEVRASLDRISAQWDIALARLRDHVEK